MSGKGSLEECKMQDMLYAATVVVRLGYDPVRSATSAFSCVFFSAYRVRSSQSLLTFSLGFWLRRQHFV